MVKEQLSDLILQAVRSAQEAGELPAHESLPIPELDPPRNKAHGDYASNIALVLAGVWNQEIKARAVADTILKYLTAAIDQNQRGLVKKAEVAGPGFINLTLRPDWLFEILRQIDKENASYGRSTAGAGVKVQVEYVSANPNGPITVAHGRGGAIGDAIAALLEATGFDVQREFYINDALNSTQMINFAKTVHVEYMRLLGHDMGPDPEWFYKGQYVVDIARSIVDRQGNAYENANIDDPEIIGAFRQFTEKGIIEQQKADLAAFGVAFDNWFSEATLFESGKVTKTIEELEEKGYTYKHEGALWFRATAFGEDKDEVLVRTGGAPAYFAGDIAYHRDKLDRGFDKVIDVWGADHAGHVSRTKAGIQALGCDPARVHILLFQLVRIMRNGELVRSSKRRGNILELRADLIDEIGKDAARFFFLMRSSDSALDIDLDLAKEQSSKNPVYYVQYAHARACSVFEKAAEAGVAVPAADRANLARLTLESEIDLIKKMGDWPEELAYAASEYAPHRVTHYIRDLAALFHAFYDAGNNDPSVRVLCEDAELRDARLVLVNATRIVLKNALSLLGLSAPEKM
jgi:arginyl-tRNA synthetase